MIDKLKNILKRGVTFLILPHSGKPPWRITFSVPFIILLFILWSSFLVWVTYLSLTRFDYWKAKIEKEMLQVKFSFLANALKNYKDLLFKIHENDRKIRELLNLQTKERIIKEGRGGPTKEDEIYLQKFLSNKIYELDELQLRRQLDLLKQEIDARLSETNLTLHHVNTLRKMYRFVPIGFPAKGNIVSPYGYRVHPVYKVYEFHSGIDISGAYRSPIYATADGRVIFCGWEHGYGLLVIIEHDFGFSTYYSHLDKILVKKGDRVKRNQVVGLMGTTGTSTGVHLHYEVRKLGKSLNPYHYLTPRGFYEKEMMEYVRKNER